jgi:hypothetical protein
MPTDRELLGRITWLQLEMMFVYDADYALYVAPCGAALPLEFLHSQTSFGTFQRTVVKSMERWHRKHRRRSDE